MSQQVEMLTSSKKHAFKKKMKGPLDWTTVIQLSVKGQMNRGKSASPNGKAPAQRAAISEKQML